MLIRNSLTDSLVNDKPFGYVLRVDGLPRGLSTPMFSSNRERRLWQLAEPLANPNCTVGRSLSTVQQYRLPTRKIFSG